MFSILRRPRRSIFEILRVSGDLHHQRIDAIVGDSDETLRAALGAARVPIDFDESVVEIDARIVGHPIDSELQPIPGIAALIEADELADGFGLRGLGDGGCFVEVEIRLGEIFGVEPRWDAVIGSPGAIDLLLKLSVDLGQAGIQGVMLGEFL